MNKELIDALKVFEHEKGIPFEYLFEKIKEGIKKAVENDHKDAVVIVDLNPENGAMSVWLRKTIVDEVENPECEITAVAAASYSTAIVSGCIDVPIDIKDLRRISTLNAKNIIRQAIRDAEREHLYSKLQEFKHEIVNAYVKRVDPEREDAIIEISNFEVNLPRREQLPTEHLKEGDSIKIYVVDVFSPAEQAERALRSDKPKAKEPKIMISRTHPDLVKRLFETEVPEIYDGTVEIKAISREAGSRTKIAVDSSDPNVDPVGSCIGLDGGRVRNIVKELCGEKIEVVRYSADPVEFIKAALSPANVVAVEIDTEQPKCCHVSVPDSQLSLAIGNKGQSARLAAKLTGWKIDIRPESGYWGE